jgi:hypothetical protein
VPRYVHERHDASGAKSLSANPVDRDARRCSSLRRSDGYHQRLGRRSCRDQCDPPCRRQVPQVNVPCATQARPSDATQFFSSKGFRRSQRPAAARCPGSRLTCPRGQENAIEQARPERQPRALIDPPKPGSATSDTKRSNGSVMSRSMARPARLRRCGPRRTVSQMSVARGGLGVQNENARGHRGASSKHPPRLATDSGTTGPPGNSTRNQAPPPGDEPAVVAPARRPRCRRARAPGRSLVRRVWS